jgi:aspartyl-tRNA(Asn)/glutamyl-tRNA(Gln) amidotransferase subunit A
MDFSKLSLKELIDLVHARKITASELVDFYIKRIQKFKDKNVVLEVFDDAKQIALEKDKFASQNKELPILHGIPILIKDNISYEGHRLSCASKFLENYVSPYNATVIQKLLDNGAIILGRTNMDEFAMGGSTENSAFGVAKNALDDTRVSGGSSGGSASAMALGLAAITLGSDTGGSIRQPSSFNGVVGLKPTYGRVSRYGLVAFASSLDQIGPISKTVEDNAILMNIIAGEDQKDFTSSKINVPDFTKNIGKDVSGLVFGVPTEIMELLKKTEYLDKYTKLFKFLEEMHATIKEVSIPDYKLSLPVYYVLAPAEASSNLGRFDGIKYTKRDENAYKIDEIYNLSRTKYFGEEVKRRIMLGNFVLSSGYYDAYYMKSKKIKELLKTEVCKAFDECNAILMPTTFGEAFKIGEKSKDPVSMYAEDMFTIFANLTEVPAISVPFETGKNGLPLGLQILGKHFDEPTIYGIANFIEKNYKEKK